MKMNDLKGNLINEMEAYFGEDRKRIHHALEVTRYVEELFIRERGANYRIVVAAGLLHDIGIHVAEEKYGNPGGKFQEIEGPPIARRILQRLDFADSDIAEICEIIAHHHSPGKINTTNFKILFDADWLVNLRDEYDIKDKIKLETIIEKVFLTDSGKTIAKEKYL